jgi:transmembrane sensor
LERKVRTPSVAKGKKGRRWLSTILGTVFAVLLALCASIYKPSIQYASEQVIAAMMNATRPLSQAQTITTDVGERKSIQLANDAELALNTRSTVHVDPNPKSRSVVLERGEVIFNALDDPWVLRCDDLEIKVVSAKIHVRYEAMDSSSRLNVIEGQVSVRRAAQVESSLPGYSHFDPIVVRAGEYLMIRASLGAPERFNPAEVRRRRAWMQGVLILQGDSLKDAVAELNRYNKRRLVIGDDSITRLVLGGTFDVTRIDEFAESLNKLFGIRAVPMPAGGAGQGGVMLYGPDYPGI